MTDCNDTRWYFVDWCSRRVSSSKVEGYAQLRYSPRPPKFEGDTDTTTKRPCPQSLLKIGLKKGAEP